MRSNKKVFILIIKIKSGDNVLLLKKTTRKIVYEKIKALIKLSFLMNIIICT